MVGPFFKDTKTGLHFAKVWQNAAQFVGVWGQF